MNKKLVKALSLIIAAAMSTGLLASCGGNKPKDETKTPTTTTEAKAETPAEEKTETPTEAATEAATEAPTEAATEAPTEAPTEAATEAPTEAPTEAATEAPTEKKTEAPAAANADADLPELIYWTIGGTPKDLQEVNDAINEYAAAEVGAKVKYMYSGWGEYSDKMNQILNTNDPYDLAFGASITGYQQFAGRGMFADLTEVLKNDAQDLYKYIPESLWLGMTLPNGEIFGVPAYKDTAMTQYWIYDKAMVVDELKWDINSIKTLDDMEPLLEAITKANKDKNRYCFYLTPDGINNIDHNDYEPIVGPLYVRVGDPENKVVNLFAEEEIQHRFKKIAEWQKKGYINPDADIITHDNIPKGGDFIGSAQGFPGAEANWSDGHGSEVVAVPFYGPVFTTQSIQGSFVVVNAVSEHVTEAVKYLQKVNLDPTLRNLVAFGIEGKHWNFTDDKKDVISFTDKHDDYGVPAYSQGTFFTMYPVAPNKADQWTLVKEQNDKATSSNILGFMFDVSGFEQEVTGLNSIQEKYMASLMTGKGDTEKILKDMIKEQEVYLETLKPEVEKQLGEWLKNKKK